MPKTYTDDVAAALPSSIDGPFQIVDPSDPTSWLKIEPSSARIAAAGDARPNRVLTTSYVRSYLSTGSNYIGTGITGRTVTASSSGGFYTAPFRIPEDMDLTEPSSVSLLIGTVFDATTNGQAVRLYLAHTRVTLAGSQSSNSVTLDWNAPDDWTTSEYQRVLMDNGNGRTFEADLFTAGEILGLRLSRVGGDAADTYNKTIKFAEYLEFAYTAKLL